MRCTVMSGPQVKEMGFSLVSSSDPGHIPVLEGCFGYITLLMENYYPAGDHDVAICTVEGHSYGPGTCTRSD